MKKIIFYLLGIIVIIFLIPIMCTSQTKETSINTKASNIPQESFVENNYDYKQYQLVRLLHTSNNNIQEINLDEYLYGVVAAEMPADFSEEALKAQAVVARTYTVYKIINNNSKHGEAQICDDSKCCQAWISKDDRFEKWKENEREENWRKIVNAVNSTQGKIIMYENKPINAFFHSNSGGKTEIPINVWGGSGLTYLQVVETSGEENYSQYSSEVIISKEELQNIMSNEYSDFTIDYNDTNCIEILEYTTSGRVKTIKIGNKNLSGVEARSIFKLKSTNFNTYIEGNNIRFTVKGYGHGIGMSQTGADSLAKEGKNYEEIINHFYIGVQIKDM